MHEQFPQSFEQEVDKRFFTSIYNNADQLLEELPDVVTAAYQEEMVQIDDIKDSTEQEIARVEFAKRLVHENVEPLKTWCLT